MRTVAWVLAASSGLILLAGCGLAANPQPPTAWLPQPVRDLTAARVGNDVHLHWDTPRNSTDRLALKRNQRGQICWTPAGADPRSCNPAGEGLFAPDQPAGFTVHLAPDQTSGPPRALAFFVELQNRAGKTAGPSNPALVSTGAAPPPVARLSLDTRAEGVVLHWDPAAPQTGLVLRIHRLLVHQPNTSKPGEGNGAPPPDQQTLEVNLDKADPGRALDRDATLDHIWRYQVQRVLHVTAAGHALEITSVPSAPTTIDAKDTFPPQVPAGLAAVPDNQAHSIDLSWVPDPDADLAGYAVYRRDLTAATSATRISGDQPLVPPAFADKTVASGHRYAYTVTAIDRDGNESAHSAEVEEQLPQDKELQ